MRLLIITQVVDSTDSNLGFFHRWLVEFAKHCAEVTVIAQRVGEYDLPHNVRVVSLGKEHGYSKLRQLFNFYRIIWRKTSSIDKVFVHMIPMWVVLGAPVFKLFQKPVYLWYVHRSVTPLLRLAERLAEKIFTASKESFRLASRRVAIIGHGIDTAYFVPRPELRLPNVFRIMTAGRIAESKRIKEMVLVIAELKKNHVTTDKKIEFAVIGGTRNSEDVRYLSELKTLVSDLGLGDSVYFTGSKPYLEIATEYQKSDLFLNFSLTGSIDKAVLEAMACGCDVLIANEAFFDILPKENLLRDLTQQKLAERIANFSAQRLSENNLRQIVLCDYDLKTLIQKIIHSFTP